MLARRWRVSSEVGSEPPVGDAGGAPADSPVLRVMVGSRLRRWREGVGITPHRLERYHAGRCMDFETAGPGDIAAAIASEINRKVDYLPVATEGAARAAALIADLL